MKKQDFFTFFYFITKKPKSSYEKIVRCHEVQVREKFPPTFFFHNGIFHLPSTQNFQKVNITYPLTRTGTRTYQVVRNVIFSENE